MCFLELSKTLMCEFHYDYIKNKYANSSRLLFTDTDSLIYEIKTEDFYKKFSTDKVMFGFSDYSNKSKLMTKLFKSYDLKQKSKHILRRK